MSDINKNDKGIFDKNQEVSIKYSFQKSLRRCAIGFPPRINQLRKKLAKSFPQFKDMFLDKQVPLRLVYTDNEGDACDITTNDEFLAAYTVAQETKKVLKFDVHLLSKEKQSNGEIVKTQPDNLNSTTLGKPFKRRSEPAAWCWKPKPMNLPGETHSTVQSKRAVPTSASMQKGGFYRWSRRDSRATAQFVKDLTVNDRSRKFVGEKFEKAWVLRAGQTGMPAGCSLVFIGGCDLDAENLRVLVGDQPFPPGKEFLLKINFTAPKTAGHYRSFWRLQTPKGQRFGPRIWADIVVVNDSSETKENERDDPDSSEVLATCSNHTIFNMKFLRHLNFAEGSVVCSGQTFNKTWLISTQSGWQEGIELRCTDMWSSFVGLAEAVPPVPKNAQAELSITLTAPTQCGYYRSYWSLADTATGQQFGTPLFVDFHVVSPDLEGN